MTADPELSNAKRDYLKPHHGKRITIEGRIQKWGKYFDGRMRRDVESVCLQDVDIIEVNDLRWSLCDHVWVGLSQPVREVADVGDKVRMDVRVYDYLSTDPNDHNKRSRRYGLREPQDVTVVHSLSGRPRIPPPPTTVADAVISFPELMPPMEPVVPPEPLPPPKSIKPAVAAVLTLSDVVPLDDIDGVLRLVRDHGFDSVERAVAAVRQMGL